MYSSVQHLRWTDKKGGQRMSMNKRYGVGCLLLLFGGAGIAECITSNRGIFIVSAIVFAIGFALILDSYDWKK